MDVLAFMGETGRLFFRVLVVIAPLLAWQWIFAFTRNYRGDAGPAKLTVIASAMVGIAALAALLPETTLTWAAIVNPGGFWDMDLPDFLTLALDIVRHAIAILLDTLHFDDQRHNFQAWLAAAFAIWFIRLAIGLILRPPRGVRSFVLAECAVFAVGVFASIYAGPMLLWSVNRLNFWLFLLLILLIQDSRYDHPPLVLRLMALLTRIKPREHEVSDHAH